MPPKKTVNTQKIVKPAKLNPNTILISLKEGGKGIKIKRCHAPAAANASSVADSKSLKK